MKTDKNALILMILSRGDWGFKLGGVLLCRLGEIKYLSLIYLSRFALEVGFRTYFYGIRLGIKRFRHLRGVYFVCCCS